jgi:hypothetical protein
MHAHRLLYAFYSDIVRNIWRLLPQGLYAIQLCPIMQLRWKLEKDPEYKKMDGQN